MHKLIQGLFFTLLFSLTPVALGQHQINVPIRFHIVEDLTMHKKGVVMNNWISHIDIERVVVPAVNKIWLPANIVFEAESIVRQKALTPVNKKVLIDNIVNARRDKNGKADPQRIKNLNQLIDWQGHDKDIINVYLVPYLGETSQGNAAKRKNRVFISQWTDKPSKAKLSPKKFTLVEQEPFKKGSFSRTLAHELGHILGLKHPNKQQQTQFGLLMGGKKAGYTLTPVHIKNARFRAEKLFSKQQKE